MKNRTKYLMMIVILLFTSTLYCQMEGNFRVYINVIGDDSIKDNIYSYLSRDLRTLGDIVLTEDEYDYELCVIGLVAENKIGNEIGIVLSIVVNQKFDNKYFAENIFKNSDNKNLFLSITGALYHEPKHYLYLTSTDGLKSLCSDFIVTFDVDTLQYVRDLRQKIKDIFNEYEENN